MNLFKKIIFSNNKSMEHQRFLLSTIDYKTFNFEDIIADGSCCFRALANCLNFYNKNLKFILNNNYFKLNNINENNNLEYDYEDWGYDGKEQKEVAKILQILAKNYILKNWKLNIVDEYGYNTLGDFVMETHNISTKKDYNELYSVFSGDNNDSNNVWGSIVELYALSKILNIPINVYSLFRYYKKSKETKMVKLTQKRTVPINTRLRIVNIFGKEYNYKKEINILFEYSKNELHHFTALYPKDFKL